LYQQCRLLTRRVGLFNLEERGYRVVQANRGRSIVRFELGVVQYGMVVALDAWTLRGGQTANPVCPATKRRWIGTTLSLQSLTFDTALVVQPLRALEPHRWFDLTLKSPCGYITIDVSQWPCH
jgi:hypothetical protein